MKFSVRQILASAVGAVIAAVIASTFGVTGTIIGVAIGSATATIGTALVAQSIDRGHQAVKQVAERLPEAHAATLLRRIGGTGASGGAASSVDAGAAPTEVVASAGSGSGSKGGGGSGSGAADETVQMESAGVGGDQTEPLEVSTSTGSASDSSSDARSDAAPGTPPDGPATERLSPATMPLRRGAASRGSGGAATSETAAMTVTASRAPAAPRRYSWKAIALAACVVFALALLFITAIELISGKPLSDIFGGAGSGTTLFGNNGGPPATSTTTTTPSSTTSTTSSSSTTSTSTTAPTGESSTTTSTPPSATTTLPVGGSVSTTTTPSGPTSP